MSTKRLAKQKMTRGRFRQWAGRLSVVVLFATCLLTGSMSAFAQEKTVRGRVTAESGDPVVGASVVIKGTTTGTTTNAEGRYTISAAKGAVLVISTVGFGKKEITVGDNDQIDVQLAVSVEDINAVVVIGYGTQRKKDVTGAVASVNLESFRDAPNTNIGQYLQGTVPGLNVGLSTVSGGTPPISIRGVVTISGSRTVLIILDGIQYTGSLSSINPDDIATIDVLKDASSTAVYGAQAANGVIMITTRRGRFNQKPRISFSSAYTVQRPTVGKLKPYDRAGLLAMLTETFYDKAYLGPDYTQPNPAFKLSDWADASWRDASGNLLNNNYSWFDEATNDGTILENNLSIAGGSDRFNYLVSGALVNQKGYIINDIFKRKSIRVNLETKPLTWWKVGVLSSGSFVNQDGAEPSFGSILRMPPLVTPYDTAGKLKPFPLNTLEPNPFNTYDVDDYDRTNYLIANIFTDIDFPFLKGLNYRMNFGNNYWWAKHNFASIYDAGLTGRAYKEFQDYYDYTFDNILTYTKSFGKHDITATVVHGAIKRKYSRTFSEGRGFSRLTLGYNNLQMASQQFATSQGEQEQLAYQMARINYKFNDRYLLTATLRRDGYSGFAKNYKYATFPVLALGWILSEEEFLKNVAWIDHLKIRAGYGVSGNQTRKYMSIARDTTLPAYIYGDGGTTAFGQYVITLGNDDLKWERTAGLNLGLDFGLFNNRLTGSLEFYRNKTRDLLFNVSIPAVTGFENIATNVGQINNTGFEAAITYRVIEKRDFKWSTTVNFSTNNNKVISLAGIDADGDGKEDDLTSSNLFIGKSLGVIYNFQTDGIYDLDDTRIPGFPIGTVRIVDQNKDNDITSTMDRVFLGRAEPAYRFSVFNSFQYKALTLTVFVNAVQGGKDGYLGNNNPNYYREDNNIRINWLQGIDFWSPRNPGGKYPRNISGSTAKFHPNMYQSRSFVRLQDISLSYNLASSVLKKTKAQSINLFVSGKNLHTWTNWEGWDPEPLDNDGNPMGLTTTGRPVLRTFTVGLNIVY